MSNDSRPVDLLSDSKGVYGIGIVYDDVREKQIMCDKHLIFRPDVIAEAAFPSEYRDAVLQTLPNHRFIMSCEWKLHEVMLAEALKRNPRYQELMKKYIKNLKKKLRTNSKKASHGRQGRERTYIVKSDGDNTSGSSSISMAC